MASSDVCRDLTIKEMDSPYPEIAEEIARFGRSPGIHLLEDVRLRRLSQPDIV
jgi:hypothetical protein